MLTRLACFTTFMLFVVSSSWAFDLQGHRGARGLFPENTLPGFAKALSIGVTTLELDTAITKDGIVVVAHDPVIKSYIGRFPNGEWLTTEPIINNLTLEELQEFDVGRLKPGSRTAARFPDQQPIDGTTIPTLAQVFDLVNKSGNTKVRFSIETKISPLKPNRTPAPETFVDALMAVIQQYKMEDRVTIQSFDWRTLQLVQKLDSRIRTSYLTTEQDWLNNVRSINGVASPWSAGFKPEDYNNNIGKFIKAAGGDIWSPFYLELIPERVRQAHAEGLRVIPWTVNDEFSMKILISMGVDGIITDYPDRLRKVLSEQNIELPEQIQVQVK